MEVILLSDVYAEGWIRGSGAYKLATELRLAGYTVQVIDFAGRLTQIEAKKLFDKFISNDTVLLGVSNTFLHSDGSKIFEQDWMLDLINEYKQRYKFKVVIGGNRGGPATLTELARNVFDILVAGFADRAIIEIANAAKNNDIGSLKGTTKHNQLYIDCRLNYVYENFHTSKTIFTKQDCLFHGEALPIETARGCKFRCSYCFYPGNGKGNTFKHLKDKTVLTEELIYNYENFGVTQYDIMDDLLNDSPEKCKYIHDVFSKLPFQIHFGAYARSDLLISHLDTLPILEESGCVGMQFGIETLHKQAGSSIGKGMDKNKTIDGLHYIKENSNISLGSGFIFGLPHEPLESIMETIKWLNSNNCPLDNKEVYALSIPSMSSHFDSSKLMIDPRKYGYKDLEPDNKNKMIWDNGYLNFYQAQQLRDDALRKFKNHNHFNAHQISRVYNMGYNLETVLTTPAAEFRKKYENIKPNSSSIINKKQKYLEMLYDV
tara:strand:+ start:1848 stop:3314 length:1467 start_codon:yes stop_codon:yes gene_type:complete